MYRGSHLEKARSWRFFSENVVDCGRLRANWLSWASKPRMLAGIMLMLCEDEAVPLVYLVLVTQYIFYSNFFLLRLSFFGELHTEVHCHEGK